MTTRRQFIHHAATAATALSIGFCAKSFAIAQETSASPQPRLRESLKYGMVRVPG